MTAPVRAVYDCVVFLQGVGRRGNAARKCLDLVDDGTVQLCLSPDVLAEIDDVLHRMFSCPDGRAASTSCP